MSFESFDVQCGEIFVSKKLNFRINCILCEKYFNNFDLFRKHCLKFDCSLESDIDSNYCGDDELQTTTVTTDGAGANFDEPLENPNSSRTFNQKFSSVTNDDSCVMNKILNNTNKSDYDDLKKFENILSHDPDEDWLTEYEPPNSSITSKNKRKPYKCDYCEKTYRSPLTLGLHLNRKHLKDENLICDICGEKSASPETLQYHKKVHNSDRPYKCHSCNKTFIIAYQLKRHINIVHKNLRPHKCNLCQKSFTSITLLNKHLKVHTNEKPYKCQLCNNCYKNEYNLFCHQRKLHLEIIPLGCNKCQKRFKTHLNLEKHECLLLSKKKGANTNPTKIEPSNKNHFELETFGVRIVDSIEMPIYKRKSREKQQEFKHIEKRKKSFMCEICGITKKTLADHKIHERIHTGEKPFKCQDCDKAFITKYYLKLHQRLHTGEKPYKCLKCLKCFRNYFRLQIHIRTHTGERPYNCELCQKAFHSATNLRQHKHNVHKILNKKQMKGS